LKDKAKYCLQEHKNKISMNYFAHETAIVDAGCEIGDGTKIWHFSHIMSSCIIGESCNIGQNVVISPAVILGKNVKIQNNVSVYTGVVCEDDVFLGPSMVFTNVINPRSHVNRKAEYAQTIVRRGASIGANATVVCGNEIGKYALIGAGAVVTKAVKDYALVMGNPARQTGWVSEYGHKLHFNEEGLATCPETKQEYKLEHTQVKRIS
jgi:UDP-2-acetamido-3-amino-2,3-dideoxy-glucuronate N-acetyltransferase